MRSGTAARATINAGPQIPPPPLLVVLVLPVEVVVVVDVPLAE